jgi:Holliday junction DNA helicase RuvA
MIGRIQGILLEKQPPEVLIDVAGVGYEIQLPMTSFYQLPQVGESVTLYTHFVVREDAQLLFGFADKLERSLFRELIKANGVGPKLGLAILSGMSAPQFLRCVELEDVSALVTLPGIGKKTAERLVIDLRDRLAKFKQQQGADIADTFTEQASTESTFVAHNDSKDDALGALVALGYKPVIASKMVNKVYTAGMSSEDVIRLALKSAL